MIFTVQIDSPGIENVGGYKDSNPKDLILVRDGFHFRLFLLFTNFIYFIYFYSLVMIHLSLLYIATEIIITTMFLL